MSDSKYTMTEEEIKAQGIAEEAEDAITDENYAEASEKNIWDGEKMVTEAQYTEIANYYATALHELGHWTGHSSRLNRHGMGSTQFGSSTYAKEELRAELASTFLSADLGIPMNTQNHAAYIESWLQALKNDKTEIFKAANDASKIARYLEDYVRDLMKEKLQNKAEEEKQEETVAAEPEKTAEEAKAPAPPAKEPEAEKPKAVTPTSGKAASKLYVAIHQLPAGSDWRFDSWKDAQSAHDKSNPMDFKKYEQKWQEAYPYWK